MKCKGYTLANLWTEKVREFNFNVKRQEVGGGGGDFVQTIMHT